ncbi:hypothetical protein FRC17_009409 [Serendipita sp. 399]|nr:hypothetical protein FRC17_009409 [Serendipita sp. 399]
MHQSQTSPFTYQQQAVLFQQRLLEHEQDLAQQLLLEQQRQMQHYPTFRSSPKEESPPNQIMPQTSHPSTPSTSGDVSTLYQETAFIHDFMAEDRLNIGAKENQLLPSGLPSIPSLSVRTPAPRSHPYSSPRLSGITSPRGTGLSLDRKGSLRSVRPLVPRGTVGSLKRESLSSTTAYVAGLRRPIPSLAAAMSALERTPIDPYGRATVTPFGPINFYGPSTAGNPGITGSASTASTSLPPESPLPSTSTGGFESPGTQRASIIGAPASPFKELSSPLAPTDNSLRLHRGGGSVGNAPVRPSTASTVDMRSSPPLYASPVQGSSSKVLPSAASLDRVQSQTRATASRKRADDDILNHSFRAEGDWRRRAVLDNVLTASFVMDNIMEPNCTGADDPITMGLGSEGKSVYAVFLEQTERSQWRCLFGDKDFPCGSQATSFKRLERALDHVRSHLNHRPYACKGECQKGDSW